MDNDNKKKIVESHQKEPQPLTPDKNISVEQRSFAQAHNKILVKITEELHDARITYCKKIFTIIIIWLTFTAAILILTSIGTLQAFDSSVLIALITSTTVAALGLFLVVSRLLLTLRKPSNQEHPDTPAISPLLSE